MLETVAMHGLRPATYRENLRDIEATLRSVAGRLYHMEIRGRVARSSLAHTNENRDWRIYADFAQVLIQKARALCADEPFAVELEKTIYALDSPASTCIFRCSLGPASANA